MKDNIVYLTRHGEPLIEDIRQKRYIGQLDISLSSRGIEQAHYLAEILSKHPIRKVYASDLARSRQTADIIASALNLQPEVISDLREIYLGVWEGLLFKEVQSLYPEEYEKRGKNIYHHRPPGGESFAECGLRVLNAYHQIVSGADGQILIIAHAGVNRLILCDILGMPKENLFMVKQNYGCLNVIRKTDTFSHVHIINQVFL